MNGLNLTSFTSGSEVSFIQTLPLQVHLLLSHTKKKKKPCTFAICKYDLGLIQFLNLFVLWQANTQLTPGSHASPAHATRVTTTTNAGLDGTFKPRARARRGHATDPHSIAERVSYY